MVINHICLDQLFISKIYFLITTLLTFLNGLLNAYIAFYNADLPWPDLRRNKVGKPSNIATDVRSIALIVNELTPSSEVANAKII